MILQGQDIQQKVAIYQGGIRLLLEILWQCVCRLVSAEALLCTLELLTGVGQSQLVDSSVLTLPGVGPIEYER